MEYYLQDKEHNQVVVFNNVVYHVKDYMPNHPGGAEYLSDRLGKVIDNDFEEAEHTKSARNIMKELPIMGKLANSSDSTS